MSKVIHKQSMWTHSDLTLPRSERWCILIRLTLVHNLRKIHGYLWSTNDKFSRWLNVEHSFAVYIFFWNDDAHNLVHELFSQFFYGNELVVLKGDNDGVYAQRNTCSLNVFVLHRHLGGIEMKMIENILINTGICSSISWYGS